jgi:hypothetical protein
MGDRTAASLIIYKIGQRGGSRKVRDEIASILREAGLRREFDDDPDPSPDNLVGAPWTDYEFSLGMMDPTISELLAVEPRIWLRAQEDAYSPWIGEMWMYTPDLGMWRANCSDEGVPMFTDNEVREMVSMRLTDQDPDGRLMERRLGKPWFDEFALIRGRAPSES